VADVQPRPDVAGQQRVAGDNGLLGGRRPAGETQPGRHDTLVQLRAGGEPGLLGVLGDHSVEGPDVLQGAAHQGGVGHAGTVVTEHPHTRGRVGHRAELGQLRTRPSHRDRTDRRHIDQPGLAAEPPHLLDDACGVGGRVGVGHGEHRGVPAERGRRRPGRHGLGILAARFAQVGVQVDQAGQQHRAGSVDHLVSGAGQITADRRDHPTVEQHVDRVLAVRSDAA